MGLAEIKEYLYHLYWRIQKNELSALGAQLSYYFIISIFPFLIFLLTLLDYTPLTKQDTLQQLALILPGTVFSVIKQVIAEITKSNNFTFLSLGFLGTIWTASRGTHAIIRSVNKAYGAEESRSFWQLNIIGVLSTFALALVIMFSLGLLVFGEMIGVMIFKRFGLVDLFYLLWHLLRYLIPIIIIFFVFSFIYLYSPNFSLRFRDVYPGAIFSTLGWIAASRLFAFYVNNFGNFTITYGSLGGIIVFLVWLYISSVVILLGGEINAALLHVSKKSNQPTKSIMK